MSSWYHGSRRDRHQRGIRGPMALPNKWTRRPVRAPRALTDEQFFARTVQETVTHLEQARPHLFSGVAVGFEDVPNLPSSWRHNRVPLAAAVESPDGALAQVVLFRRPLERRAASREGLRILIRHTLVEQLAVLLDVRPEDIDPLGSPDSEDD